MANRISPIIFLFGLLAATSLFAQVRLPNSQNTEKIKGSRFVSYPGYSGSPYLSDKFLYGEIEFVDGTKIDNIGLRYSAYRDEIIYYNKSVLVQIVIDKMSLKGFSFTDEQGKKRVFRRQYYNGYNQGECFFEVLSDGKIVLLAYRKVDLGTCDPSYSKLGLAYQQSYSYYLYSADKGYSLLKINRKSLLSKFDKPNQKLVRRTLRKNSVFILDEASFVKAWNLIKDKGINPIL